MRVLVINSGSSSIKFSMYEVAEGEPRLVYDGQMSGVGESHAALELKGSSVPSREGTVEAGTLEQAIGVVLDAVSCEGMPGVEAVGYRVVHPGAKLRGHQRITDEVLTELEAAAAFAPLHDPAVVTVIKEGMKRFAGVGHYACFDTVFHESMSEEATVYPVPKEYRERGVRRYGFHGLSCESVVRQMRMRGELPKRMVIAHLGSGCSVTAVVDGVSVDTSMGLTPTGGVVMGTRPGDLDPGLVLYLLRQQEGDAVAAVEGMLNHKAGIVALTGMENDFRLVRQAAGNGDEDAVLALKVFTRSVLKVTGGYSWLMGGLDAVVFAGGIGEHDAATRMEVLDGLREMGVCVNAALNSEKGEGVRAISASESKTAVYVVPAQEDLMIAVHVGRMAGLGK